MGQELTCTARSSGKTSSGKALLETNEITFRGDFRLKIPLASLKSVVACEGELHLAWPGDSVVLELGEHSAKWAHKILHPKSTLDKLGIKPGLAISALGVTDAAFLKQARAIAESFSSSRALKSSDLIFLGARSAQGLARMPKLIPALAPNGALWIVYPKGKQEVREIQVIEVGRAAGLVDVKVVSFSATHTALKFVRHKGKR